MATATKRKFISGISILCAVMLIVGIFPIISMVNNKAQATSLSKIYEADATLYDYFTDNEINGGVANGSDLGGYQDPYTILNSKIANSEVNDGYTRIYYHKIEDWYTVGAHIYTKGVDGKFGNKEYSSIGNFAEKMSYGPTTVDGVTYEYYIDVDLRNVIKNSYDALLYVEFYKLEDYENSGYHDYYYSNHTEAVSIIANYTNYCERYCKNQETWENATRCNKRVVNFKSTGTSEFTYPLYFGTFHKGDQYGAEDYIGYTENTKPGYSKFLWSANIAQRNQFTTSIEGLVYSTLGTGDTLLDKSNQKELPYFNKTWLESKNVGKAYEGNKLQFDLGDDLYYRYNSENANQAVYYTGGSLVRDTKYAVYNNNTGDSTKYYGFFPFTSDNSGRYNNSNGASNLDGNTVNPKLNMGFGLVLDIDFKLPQVSQASDAKDALDRDIIFRFTGDDDVWVFVDGNLALDLGGGHTSASGEINFTKQTVTLADSVDISKSGDTIKDRNDGSKLGSKIGYTFSKLGLDSLEYDASTEHTIKFFYMERGMIESNLSIEFNMPVILHQNNLTIEEKTIIKGIVNDGLLADTVRAAEKDVFTYTVKNKGTASEDVPGSGFKYATNEDITRERAEVPSNERAILAKKAEETVDTSHFYLDTGQKLSDGGSNIYWDDSATIIAYLYDINDTSKNKFVVMDKSDKQEHLYYVDKESYTNIIFLRCQPGTNPDNYSNKNDIWGQVILNNRAPGDKVEGWSMVGESNVVKIKGWGANQGESNNAEYGSNISSLQSVEGNFSPSDSTDFNNVSGVVYQVTDPYATNNTKFTGITDETNGSFNLMHDQSSYFTGQFKENTTMSVVQSLTLGKTVISSDDVVKFSDGSRNTADYYTTTVSATDKNKVTLFSKNKNEFSGFNSTGGEYGYSNDDNSVPVDITETYVNTIRVGSVEIKKDITPSEENSRVFKFAIRFTNLFANGVSVEDYSEVKILGAQSDKLSNIEYNDLVYGYFEMSSDSTAVISGIPVGTDYVVEELEDALFIENGTGLENISGTVKADSTISVKEVNTRRTGSISLSKVFDESGEEITDAEKTATYKFNVVLVAPDGVDLKNYAETIKNNDVVMSESDWDIYSSSKLSAVFDVTKSTGITLKGIPYGTKYTVTEKLSDEEKDNWEVTGEVSNIELKSENQYVEIKNKKIAIETTEYVVQKIWEDYSMTKGTTMTLSLTGNGETVNNYKFIFDGNSVVVEPNKNVYIDEVAETVWTIKFDQLPKKDDGVEIEYNVREISVNGVDGDRLGRVGNFVISERTSGLDDGIDKEITNIYNPIKMPESGGEGFHKEYALLGIGAITISVLAFFLLNKKRIKS